MANLAIFAGIRKDISKMEDNERAVLTEILLLMDKYDPYGKIAIPKKHDFETVVPELYRLAAEKGGVFEKQYHLREKTLYMGKSRSHLHERGRRHPGGQRPECAAKGRPRNAINSRLAGLNAFFITDIDNTLICLGTVLCLFDSNTSLSGLVAPALCIISVLIVPHGFIFMNQCRGALPSTTCQNHRITQIERLTTGGTGFKMHQFLSIHDCL
jgi:hypothetical protein